MKNNMIEAIRAYYQYLLERLNNAEKYFNGLSEEEKKNVYETKEYMALERIIKELSEIESIVNDYSIFKDVEL
ncbi:MULTISPECIES: hypothetical protein [Terrisporobacter]|uniref:Uncharacterized protein n=1 Tax=Terrisporobacter muris TaxID=2963284 RepID=A0A9X2MBH7_9FIRM|nr:MULTISPECIES: hypothetical protein [Terrisporobacter]MCR1823219.1 hypothetical protein [Terrisporobacter muris]MDY3374204.1 hypothetical protein [Terrisporobacter othiniensis]